MLELRNLVQQELESNCTLELEQSEPTIEDKRREAEEFDQEFQRLAKLDEEWRDYMSQSAGYSHRSAEDEERRQFFFDSLVKEETLQQHLLDQVHSSDFSPEDRKIAELIIGNIDDHGFLQNAPEDIANNTGMDVADITRVLDHVHTFHPVGVAARDLRECLLIQLKRLGKEQSLEYRIVDRFIEDLGKRRFPEIARRLNTTPEQVQRAANFIATLDPKPGQIFTPDPNNYVLPDVTVEKIGTDWQISLNGEQIPHLRISKTYKDLMTTGTNGTDVRDYIREKIRSGKFLIKSIHQRQQTILNIAVLENQDKAIKLLDDHPSVEKVERRGDMLIVTLIAGTTDYSELAALLVAGGLRLSLFKEDELNLETAFMRLTKGMVQ